MKRAGEVGGGVSTALVVGGGITGSMLALALAQRGVRADLVEISPVWHGVGHSPNLDTPAEVAPPLPPENACAS